MATILLLIWYSGDLDIHISDIEKLEMLQSGTRFRCEPSSRACLLGLIAWDHLYIQAKVENKINQNKIYIFKLRGILGRGPLRPPPPPDPSFFRQLDIQWFICVS